MNVHSKPAAEYEHQAGTPTATACPMIGAAPTPAKAPLVLVSPRSSWGRLLVGRLLQRVCSSGRQECSSDHCRFRVFCKCAREDFHAAAALETKSYLLLAVCGLAGILYWFFGR